MTAILASPPALETWGGIECSRVRIAGRYSDQLTTGGHDRRLDDLDRIAELGFKRLRYPILWERHPERGGQIDWRWADERLHRLRELGIRPIVGFIHHGAGPLPDGLLDSRFAEGLARFAGQFAERYPWIDAYTPINEPGTTARFSGLYGLWHPHGKDDGMFTRCFLAQCVGIKAAMAAVRAVTPGAKLVQTEDVGKTHSTARLAYQADFDNARRWLTFDLLAGRLDRSHALWPYLVDHGADRAALDAFVSDPCPPDIIGMNYYVTSERFLDERLAQHPPATHGGNGRDTYADVAAARVRAEGPSGPEALLLELWERFRLPIAITEVQLACERDDQVRWLREIWDAARSARARGVDVRAVTAWALFGAYDWDSLLCLPRGHYETGVFDVSSGQPRATALATAWRALGRGESIRHPVAVVPGWWRRDTRFEGSPQSTPDTGFGTAVSPEDASSVIAASAPVLLIGGDPSLADAFLRVGAFRGLRTFVVPPADGGPSVASAAAILEGLRPWAIVHGPSGTDDEGWAACFAEAAAGAIPIATLAREPVLSTSSASLPDLINRALNFLIDET